METIQKVVQFNESHNWCGCLGFINQEIAGRLMVGVPIPEKGISYIYCNPSEVTFIGYTDLVQTIEKI